MDRERKRRKRQVMQEGNCLLAPGLDEFGCMFYSLCDDDAFLFPLSSLFRSLMLISSRETFCQTRREKETTHEIGPLNGEQYTLPGMCCVSVCVLRRQTTCFRIRRHQIQQRLQPLFMKEEGRKTKR